MKIKPLVIALTETWLKAGEDNSIFNIPGYHPIIHQPRPTKGGGVALYINESLDFEEYTIKNYWNFELVEVKIKLHSAWTHLALLYNTPKTPKQLFLSSFEQYLSKLNAKNAILCGDINIDLQKSDLISRQYLTCLESSSFKVHNHEPTRTTRTSSTCLDHFISNFKHRNRV